MPPFTHDAGHYRTDEQGLRSENVPPVWCYCSKMKRARIVTFRLSSSYGLTSWSVYP